MLRAVGVAWGRSAQSLARYLVGLPQWTVSMCFVTKARQH